MCHLGLNTNYTETEPEAVVILPYKSYNYLENQCPFELSNNKKSTKNICKSEKEGFIKTSNFKKEQLLHNSVTCVK